MHTTVNRFMNNQLDKTARRNAIAWANSLVAQEAPMSYEQALFDQNSHGNLSLTQLIDLLDNRVQHVLYCSRAVLPLDESQLATLLEKSRAYNERYDITGMLYYGNGHFVQVLEGAAPTVQRLFAAIRQDERHHQLYLLSQGASATRMFADWRMAFAQPGAETEDFYWMITQFEAHRHRLLMPQIPVADPELIALLEAFSRVMPAAAG
jgi:hypothetical protein